MNNRIDSPPKSFLYAFLYGVTSIGLVITNKLLFLLYDIDPIPLFALQVISSLFIILLFKFTCCSKSLLFDFQPFDIQLCYSFLPLSIIFAANIIFTLWTLELLPLAVFTAVRKLTTLVVVTGEYFVWKKIPPHRQIIALILLVFGSLITGVFEFDFLGYSIAFISCIITAIFLVLIKFKQQSTGQSELSILYYNFLLSSPILVSLWALTHGESFDMYVVIGDKPHVNSIQLIFLLLLNTAFSFFMNISLFLCTSRNSPLTTTVTGHVKNLFVTLIGMIAGTLSHSLSFLSIIGISLTVFGSFWYSYEKYAEIQQEEATIEDLDRLLVNEHDLGFGFFAPSEPVDLLFHETDHDLREFS